MREKDVEQKRPSSQQQQSSNDNRRKEKNCEKRRNRKQIACRIFYFIAWIWCDVMIIRLDRFDLRQTTSIATQHSPLSMSSILTIHGQETINWSAKKIMWSFYCGQINDILVKWASYDLSRKEIFEDTINKHLTLFSFLFDF